jgi:hypothetical protein
MRRLKCCHKSVSINCSYFSGRFFELFEGSTGSIVPLGLVVLGQLIHTRLLEMIGEPHSPPSCGDILSRIGDPGDHRMLDSTLFQLVQIWLYICPFVLDDMDSISEESFFPGILRSVADVKSGNITTRLDIWSIYLSTRTVIKKIFWVF